METTPLPNQDSDSSDSDSTASLSLIAHYVVRVTSHSKFTSEELLSYIDAEPLICQYVIGREELPQEHYHLVIGLDSSVTEQEVRDIVKAFLVPLWEDPETHKLPRGFGNKQYNLQLCEFLDKSVSYAVKQAQYWFEGFDPTYIEARKAESFEKKSPSTFKYEYLLLCTDFQSTDMDIREFMVKFVQLKAKFGQQVVMNHVYGYAISNLVQRNPTEADNLVENFLYRL